MTIGPAKCGRAPGLRRPSRNRRSQNEHYRQTSARRPVVHRRGIHRSFRLASAVRWPPNMPDRLSAASQIVNLQVLGTAKLRRPDVREPVESAQAAFGASERKLAVPLSLQVQRFPDEKVGHWSRRGIGHEHDAHFFKIEYVLAMFRNRRSPLRPRRAEV